MGIPAKNKGFVFSKECAKIIYFNPIARFNMNDYVFKAKDLDPSKIREDYKNDHDKIYSDESLNRVQKSLALKELVHMSVCQVVNDIDLFFTRPYDLTPEEIAEKNKQEAKAFENELQLS